MQGLCSWLLTALQMWQKKNAKGMQMQEESKGRSFFEVKRLREKIDFEAEKVLSFFPAQENRVWLRFSVNRIIVTQYLTQYCLILLFVLR